jgi:hypothetical protein
MEDTIIQLTDLISSLDIDDNIGDIEIMLNNLSINDINNISEFQNKVNNLKINNTNDSDINELVNNIESMTITDNNIEIKMTSGKAIRLKIYFCGNEYKRNSFFPHWGESY